MTRLAIFILAFLVAAPQLSADEGSQKPTQVRTKKQSRLIRKHLRNAALYSETSKKGAIAHTTIAATEDSVLVPVLIDALKSPSKKVRRFAVRLLGKRKVTRALKIIGRLASRDRYKTVRIEALRTLDTLKHRDTALVFLPSLFSNDPYHRLHAVQGLSYFRDRRSVEWLVRAIRLETGRFGRVHASFITSRAYIADYEISSGGTGLVVVEVADPIIRKIKTGVVIDMDIRKVVIESSAYVLESLTGQTGFGADPGMWANWFAQNKDTFKLAPKDTEEEG